MLRTGVALALALAGAATGGCGGSSAGADAAADASGSGVDAGPDAGLPVDAAIHPDAERCAQPCLGDAVGDFSVQPGPGARFAYLDDTRAAYASYAPMTYGLWHAAMAWVGGGDAPAPVIAHCPSQPSAPECQGVESRLLLIPGTLGAGTRDPVLAWTSPVTGQVRISGSFRSPTSAIAGPERITLSRNTGADVVYAHDYLPGQTPVQFSVAVDVRGGDRILLHVAPPSSGFGAPIGFQLFFQDLQFAPSCELLASFEEAPPIDACRGAFLAERDWNGGTPQPGDLAQPASLMPELGQAIHFAGPTAVSPDYLLSAGAPLAYGGDFTIDFWARIAEPVAAGAVIYADLDCATQGGVLIAPLASTLLVIAPAHDPSKNFCGVDVVPNVQGARPTDGDWHFYRIVRVRGASLSLCIDGSKVGETTPVPDADSPAVRPLVLGDDADGNQPMFEGDLDDLRVLDRALPCP